MASSKESLRAFEAANDFLQAGKGALEIRAFSPVRVSWEQVNSRDRPYPYKVRRLLLTSARNSKLTGRLRNAPDRLTAAAAGFSSRP